jgi:hypothetical protein
MKFSEILFKIHAVTGYFHVLLAMQIIYAEWPRKKKKCQAEQDLVSILQ